MQNRSSFQDHALDFWLARGAVLMIAGLQLMFVNDSLIFGARWIAPTIEILMLIPLSFATGWTQGQARQAESDDHWHIIRRNRRMIRYFAILLTVVVTLLNLSALASVTRELLAGARGGQTLLVDALNIWFTNIVIFSLWYWNMDRGGPARLGLHDDTMSDFLFPQMIWTGDKNATWYPGFIDYLYVSFTNATAFSPTDTMPLSVQSKLLMMFEASISLLTVGLVAARAVNVLT